MSLSGRDCTGPAHLCSVLAMMKCPAGSISSPWPHVFHSSWSPPSYGFHFASPAWTLLSYIRLLVMKYLLVGQLFTRVLNCWLFQNSVAESHLLEAHLSRPEILQAPPISFPLSEHLQTVWSLSFFYLSLQQSELFEQKDDILYLSVSSGSDTMPGMWEGLRHLLDEWIHILRKLGSPRNNNISNNNNSYHLLSLTLC